MAQGTQPRPQQTRACREFSALPQPLTNVCGVVGKDQPGLHWSLCRLSCITLPYLLFAALGQSDRLFSQNIYIQINGSELIYSH